MPTTLGEYLTLATKELRSNSIDTARLDTLILMEFILGINRAEILAKPELSITSQQKNVLNSLIRKRANHVPVSQIVQSTEFYGRSFYVNRWVLEPRPESETMIDLFKWIVSVDTTIKARLNDKKVIRVADIGTGSGALGITAYLETKNVCLDLIDVDPKALKVAKRNVVLHTTKANAVKADLLSKVNTAYDILLCNLPYIPDDFKINLAASHEPKIAIYGGKDGLDIYRKLFKLLSNRQQKPLYILSESLPTSHRKLSQIATDAGYKLYKTDDFIQVFKLSQKLV